MGGAVSSVCEREGAIRACCLLLADVRCVVCRIELGGAGGCVSARVWVRSAAGWDVMHSGSSMIPAASAAGMFGQAAGMLAGGFLAAWGATGMIAMSVAGAFLTLLTPWMCRGMTFDSHAADELGSGKAWVFPLALSLTTYGPLALFSTLVTLEFGASWVGPGFLVYAVGSVVAARLQRSIKARRSHAAFVAAAGSAVWMIGFETWWLMLAGRLASGVMLFFAQGVVLTHAASSGERREFTGALVGLGVGAQLAALWSGVVADVSVVLMSASATLAGAALGVVGLFVERRGRSREQRAPGKLA